MAGDEREVKMDLAIDEVLAEKCGRLEVGKLNSYAEINDFKRCRGTTCHWGFFVSATSKIPLVKCPRCGNVQNRD